MREREKVTAASLTLKYSLRAQDQPRFFFFSFFFFGRYEQTVIQGQAEDPEKILCKSQTCPIWVGGVAPSSCLRGDTSPSLRMRTGRLAMWCRHPLRRRRPVPEPHNDHLRLGTLVQITTVSMQAVLTSL